MNPYHQALQTGLENYMNFTKAAYEPQKMQADIASKAAYATYSPYSYISKALSDPTTAMLLAQNPDQLKALTTKFANMPTNPYASLQGNQGSQGSLWDRLKEWTGLSQPKAEENQSPQQTSSIQATQPEKAADLNAQAPIVTAGGTPVGYSYTPQNLYQQNYIKQFPNSREAFNVKMQNDLWSEQLKEDAKTINSPQDQIAILNRMESTYPQLNKYEKGAYFGTLPAITSNAQNLDRLATTLSANKTRAFQSGHINKADFQTFDRIKGGRSLDKEAFNEAINYNKALAMRDAQLKKFHSDAFNKGMQIQDANNLWSKFIEQYPLFNQKTHKLNDKNYQVSPFDVSYGNEKNKQNEEKTTERSSNQSNSSGSKLPVSPAVKILASKIKLPDFDSKEAYNSWYQKQPKITRDAIKEYLRNRK